MVLLVHFSHLGSAWLCGPGYLHVTNPRNEPQKYLVTANYDKNTLVSWLHCLLIPL